MDANFTKMVSSRMINECQFHTSQKPDDINRKRIMGKLHISTNKFTFFQQLNKSTARKMYTKPEMSISKNYTIPRKE